MTYILENKTQLRAFGFRIVQVLVSIAILFCSTTAVAQGQTFTTSPYRLEPQQIRLVPDPKGDAGWAGVQVGKKTTVHELTSWLQAKLGQTFTWEQVAELNPDTTIPVCRNGQGRYHTNFVKPCPTEDQLIGLIACEWQTCPWGTLRFPRAEHPDQAAGQSSNAKVIAELSGRLIHEQVNATYQSFEKMSVELALVQSALRARTSDSNHRTWMFLLLTAFGCAMIYILILQNQRRDLRLHVAHLANPAIVPESMPAPVQKEPLLLKAHESPSVAVAVVIEEDADDDPTDEAITRHRIDDPTRDRIRTPQSSPPMIRARPDNDVIPVLQIQLGSDPDLRIPKSSRPPPPPSGMRRATNAYGSPGRVAVAQDTYPGLGSSPPVGFHSSVPPHPDSERSGPITKKGTGTPGRG